MNCSRFVPACLLLATCLAYAPLNSANDHGSIRSVSPANNRPLGQQSTVSAAELFGRAAPGGVAMVPINVPDSSKPRARFGNRDLLIMRHNGQWLALVGLPPSILPGNYVVSTFVEDSDPDSEEFSVLARAPRRPAGQDRLRYNRLEEDDEPVNAAPVAGLIDPGNARDNSSMQPLDTSEIITYSTSAPNLDLMPVTEVLEKVPYGTWFKAGSMQRHDYISYITRPDAQVYAPTDGKVTSMVSDNSTGTTIYLDHGQGLFSILSNLQQPLVAVGKEISRGEPLARANNHGSPDRGQVDWAVQLNGLLVNPDAVVALGAALQSRAQEISEALSIETE